MEKQNVLSDVASSADESLTKQTMRNRPSHLHRDLDMSGVSSSTINDHANMSGSGRQVRPSQRLGTIGSDSDFSDD